MNIDKLKQYWRIIAHEASKLSTENALNVSDCKTRSEVKSMLHISTWIKGWDGYKEWLNWGICIDCQFPFGYARLPIAGAILQDMEGLHFACLSILKAGAILPLHSHSEMKESKLVTYHLGLDVPDECYLNVDGVFIKEQNGVDISFDGSTPHYAFNASNRDRLILHLEVHEK